VGVDHGRFNVAVAEQFLDGADIVAAFYEVGREGVAEGVAGGSFGESGFQDGFMDGTLEDGFVHVKSSFFAGLGVFPAAALGEYPLPAPV